jgi:hypothetical protein
MQATAPMGYARIATHHLRELTYCVGMRSIIRAK